MKDKHRELVGRAGNWLSNSVRCRIVLLERNHTWESPDVIGWRGWQSYLIECKVSRADFLADKNKPARQHLDLGMGCYRYYLCPKGMVSLNEVPEGWGLMYPTERQIRIVVPSPFNTLSEIAIHNEIEMLAAAYANMKAGVIVLNSTPANEKDLVLWNKTTQELFAQSVTHSISQWIRGWLQWPHDIGVDTRTEIYTRALDCLKKGIEM